MLTPLSSAHKEECSITSTFTTTSLPDFSFATTKLEHSRINGSRLWAELLESSSIGGIEGTTGMNRQALNDSDKAVRDWFISRAEMIGCHVSIDEIGNIFAIMPGKDNTLDPIGMGSHLDTQPNGGRFDGILGVLGALEVLRTMKERGIVTQRPVAVINWTNEEGSRFESGCTGSAVWSAYISLEQGHAIKTIGEDSTLHSELRRIGYQGSSLADYKSNKLSGHFELHIEQGSRLERAALNIGVVNGIQGNRRLQVLVQGEKAHAGLTPMNERVDALVASSKIVLSVEAAGVRYGGFATVGVLHCEHGSINSVPEETFLTIDLRHPSSKSLDLMEACIRTDMERLESSNQRLRVKVDLVWESPAVRFDEIAVQCVRKTAQERLGVSTVAELDSFAGHDSAFTQLRVPTAMIFVPSRDGISHAPEEYTSESQCTDGVQILMEAVCLYDQLLTRVGSPADSGFASQ